MNRLSQEISPYLLQHKDNPVHWRPWGEEALAEAKRADKPILLSVGYAACHWCHVMAHESFEDDEIAALMNALFVNIKVDREERPDLDGIYQSALALMGERGGWPLTMFLTPEGEPFWGGTYFPPSPRYGRPGFPQLLHAIAEAYRSDKTKVDTNVTALRAALAKMQAPEPGNGLSVEALDEAARFALRLIDTRHGGTAGAPKFPQPTFFRFLWRAYKRRGEAVFRDAVTVTLDAICQGGIYDHLARRLRPLLHRRRLARAALREDALRQRPARRADDGSLAGDTQPALRQAHRRDDRLGDERDAGRRPERQSFSPSPARWTPTARASRASTTSGTRPRSMPSSASMRLPSRPRIASAPAATGKGTPSSTVPAWACPRTTRSASSPNAAPGCWRSAASASRRGATTRFWPTGTG